MPISSGAGGSAARLQFPLRTANKRSYWPNVAAASAKAKTSASTPSVASNQQRQRQQSEDERRSNRSRSQQRSISSLTTPIGTHRSASNLSELGRENKLASDLGQGRGRSRNRSKSVQRVEDGRLPSGREHGIKRVKQQQTAQVSCKVQSRIQHISAPASVLASTTSKSALKYFELEACGERQRQREPQAQGYDSSVAISGDCDQNQNKLTKQASSSASSAPWLLGEFCDSPLKQQALQNSSAINLKDVQLHSLQAVGSKCNEFCGLKQPDKLTANWNGPQKNIFSSQRSETNSSSQSAFKVFQNSLISLVERFKKQTSSQVQATTSISNAHTLQQSTMKSYRINTNMGAATSRHSPYAATSINQRATGQTTAPFNPSLLPMGATGSQVSILNSEATGSSANLHSLTSLHQQPTVARNKGKFNLNYVKTLIILLMSLDLMITVLVHHFSSNDELSFAFTAHKPRLSLVNLILSAGWFIVLTGAILFDIYSLLLVGCLVDIASFVMLLVCSIVHFTHRIDYNTVNLTSLLLLLFSITVLHVYLLVLAALTIYLMLAVKKKRGKH